MYTKAESVSEAGIAQSTSVLMQRIKESESFLHFQWKLLYFNLKTCGHATQKNYKLLRSRGIPSVLQLQEPFDSVRAVTKYPYSHNRPSGTHKPWQSPRGEASYFPWLNYIHSGLCGCVFIIRDFQAIEVVVLTLPLIFRLLLKVSRLESIWEVEKMLIRWELTSRKHWVRFASMTCAW